MKIACNFALADREDLLAFISKRSTFSFHLINFKFKGFTPLVAQIRRSMAKFALYRKFTNSLAISVLLSIAWVGYEVV